MAVKAHIGPRHGRMPDVVKQRFFAGQGAHGSSPLEASAAVRSGDALVVVSLERAGGQRPVPPGASQTFTLETTFVPR